LGPLQGLHLGYVCDVLGVAEFAGATLEADTCPAAQTIAAAAAAAAAAAFLELIVLKRWLMPVVSHYHMRTTLSALTDLAVEKSPSLMHVRLVYHEMRMG